MATIRITWTKPLTGGPVVEYNIERQVDAGSFAPLTTVAGTVLTFDDATVTPGTAYSYRIRAVNAAGAGEFSSSGTINTPVRMPQQPGQPKVGFVEDVVPPPMLEVGTVYWMPVVQFDHAVAAGITAGHYWVGTPTAPLQEAKNRGLKMDAELAVHAGGSGTATPELTVSRLTALKNAGFTNTIRYVGLIDEPDLQPAGTWNMQLMRDIYSAVKSVHNWPVSVLLRAHSSTYAQCPPWFASNVSDIIMWDPYLAAWYPDCLAWIEAEGARLRGDLGPTKPLVCVPQAGFVPWAQDGSHPAKRPSSTELADMGVAGLEGGGTGIGLWLEGDWNAQPTECWVNIDDCVDVWQAWQPPEQMIRMERALRRVSVDDVPIQSVRPKEYQKRIVS